MMKLKSNIPAIFGMLMFGMPLLFWCALASNLFFNLPRMLPANLAILIFCVLSIGTMFLYLVTENLFIHNPFPYVAS
jgi:hypothetical protein